MRFATVALVGLLLAPLAAAGFVDGPRAGEPDGVVRAGPLAGDEDVLARAESHADAPDVASAAGESPSEVPVDPALADLLSVPDAVASWFATDGDTVARSGATTVLGDAVGPRADDVTVGTPRTVLTWSPQLLAGEGAGPVLVPTTRTVAPVVLDGSAVGVIVVDTGETPFTGEVRDVPGLAEPLQQLAPGVAVVHDERTEAWYAYAGGTVAPLDARAGELLAGSADLAAFLPYLIDGESGVPPEQEDDGPNRAPVVIGVIVVGGVLVAAAFAVWFRGDDEDEDQVPATQRLRARIRADLRSERPGSWTHRR